jgi:hypothetical protein
MMTQLLDVTKICRGKFAAALCVIGVLALSCDASADVVRKERVKFAKGTSSATLSDTLKGRDTLEYTVGASSGQHMRAKLASSSNSVYFNIFAPGKLPGKDEALFIGDTGGDTFDGVLPASGNYTIQVYLYRNAARAGKSAKFSLDVAIDTPAGSSTDALVPGTNFNASGMLGCARDAGQPLGQCKFGVIRQGGGNAELTIFWPDAGSRVIWFEKGVPVRYDQSQADGDAKLSFTKNADLFSVKVGTQRFEFPDAAVNGG